MGLEVLDLELKDLNGEKGWSGLADGSALD